MPFVHACLIYICGNILLPCRKIRFGLINHASRWSQSLAFCFDAAFWGPVCTGRISFHAARTFQWFMAMWGTALESSSLPELLLFGNGQDNRMGVWGGRNTDEENKIVLDPWKRWQISLLYRCFFPMCIVQEREVSEFKWQSASNELQLRKDA